MIKTIKERQKSDDYLAQQVRAEMRRRGIGVRELGRILDIDPSLISKHIGSATRPPSARPGIEFIKKYTDFLGHGDFYLIARTKGFKFDAQHLMATIGPELRKEIDGASPELQKLIQDLALLSTPINLDLPEIEAEVPGYELVLRQDFIKKYNDFHGDPARGYAEFLGKPDIETWTNSELDEAIEFYNTVWSNYYAAQKTEIETPEAYSKHIEFIQRGQHELVKKLASQKRDIGAKAS